jgi:hypothetical protein
MVAKAEFRNETERSAAKRASDREAYLRHRARKAGDLPPTTPEAIADWWRKRGYGRR